MKRIQETQNRVVAIHPYSRGFGFAILEGPEQLIDWGTKEIRGEKNIRCLKQVEDLMERYRPDMIAIEDYSGRGFRRCSRVRELIFGIVKLAVEKKIRIKTVSKQSVKTVFWSEGASSKHQVAVLIAERFPELGPSLPPKRKCYMSENPMMSIFDAVAWGFVAGISPPIHMAPLDCTRKRSSQKRIRGIQNGETVKRKTLK